MTGIVITGGRCPSYCFIEKYIKDDCYIVAADSGLEYCMKNGIKPDYIIGDMDSLRDETLLHSFPPAMVERHSSEKDNTDTELGLEHMYQAGMDSVILIGGGGGRPDHFLAIYSLFFRARKPDFWITHNSIFSTISGLCSFSAEIDEEISLFPLDACCRMRSKGLFWPLDQLEWGLGDTGISNKASENTVSIEVLRGELLMVQSLKSSDCSN
ncbi:MAG: thiamine diphosphokinase [Spirochaetaceae bacterium 4572_59]|nr:MAG: thiamine diphosphokinase [Spirochaetaceae bacterium 4572_59]